MEAIVLTGLDDAQMTLRGHVRYILEAL